MSFKKMFSHTVSVIEVTQVADSYMGMTNTYTAGATGIKGRLISADPAGGIQIAPAGAFDRHTHVFLSLTEIDEGNLIDDEDSNRYWIRKAEKKSRGKKHHHYKYFLERTDENIEVS